MSSPILLKSCPTDRVQLERVNFYPRQLLTDGDMIADQEYFREKLRRHNRFLHGWGVVCGLEVKEEKEKSPGRISIGAGYALSPCGDEIYVGEPFFLDLAQCGPKAVTAPCSPERGLTAAAPRGPFYLAIRYDQCLAKPKQVEPAGCACDEKACEYSRIQDSYQIECLTDLPASHNLQWPPDHLLCNGLAPCPPEPSDPWVVLAKITFNNIGTFSTNFPLEDNHMKSIDPSFRRHIYSTALLQKELEWCCCREGRKPLAEADLEITGDLSARQERIIVTFKVTNHGPDTADNVVVKMSIIHDGIVIIPEQDQTNFTFNTEGNNAFITHIGKLNKDDYKELKITLEYDLGYYSYSAEVHSDTWESDLKNNKCSGDKEINRNIIIA